MDLTDLTKTWPHFDWTKMTSEKMKRRKRRKEKTQKMGMAWILESRNPVTPRASLRVSGSVSEPSEFVVLCNSICTECTYIVSIEKWNDNKWIKNDWSLPPIWIENHTVIIGLKRSNGYTAKEGKFRFYVCVRLISYLSTYIQNSTSRNKLTQIEKLST